MTPMQELAVFAEGLLITREEGYAKFVEIGKMTQAEADHGIAVGCALAEIWRAAFECRIPEPEKIGTIDDHDIIMDMIVAHDRVTRSLARTPNSPTQRRQQERIEAILYWHRRHEQGPITCVRMTLEIRRQIAAENEKKDAA